MAASLGKPPFLAALAPARHHSWRLQGRPVEVGVGGRLFWRAARGAPGTGARRRRKAGRLDEIVIIREIWRHYILSSARPEGRKTSSLNFIVGKIHEPLPKNQTRNRDLCLRASLRKFQRAWPPFPRLWHRSETRLPRSFPPKSCCRGL